MITECISCVPRNKHKVGKDSAMNRNEGLGAASRERLNKVAQCTKVCANAKAMLTLSRLCLCGFPRYEIERISTGQFIVKDRVIQTSGLWSFP